MRPSRSVSSLSSFLILYSFPKHIHNTVHLSPVCISFANPSSLLNFRSLRYNDQPDLSSWVFSICIKSPFLCLLPLTLTWPVLLSHQMMPPAHRRTKQTLKMILNTSPFTCPNLAYPYYSMLSTIYFTFSISLKCILSCTCKTLLHVTVTHQAFYHYNSSLTDRHSSAGFPNTFPQHSSRVAHIISLSFWCS